MPLGHDRNAPSLNLHEGLLCERVCVCVCVFVYVTYTRNQQICNIIRWGVGQSVASSVMGVVEWFHTMGDLGYYNSK